jgi:hypothetical protein
MCTQCPIACPDASGAVIYVRVYLLVCCSALPMCVLSVVIIYSSSLFS